MTFTLLRFGIHSVWHAHNGLRVEMQFNFHFMHHANTGNVHLIA